MHLPRRRRTYNNFWRATLAINPIFICNFSTAYTLKVCNFRHECETCILCGVLPAFSDHKIDHTVIRRCWILWHRNQRIVNIVAETRAENTRICITKSVANQRLFISHGICRYSQIWVGGVNGALSGFDIYYGIMARASDAWHECAFISWYNISGRIAQSMIGIAYGIVFHKNEHAKSGVLFNMNCIFLYTVSLYDLVNVVGKNLRM